MNLEKIAQIAGVSRSTVSRVINNHPYVSEEVRQRLVDRRMPLVVIGHTDVPGVSTVDVDNLQAARSAVEHLIRLGRKRIAHITGQMNLIATRERFRGYRAALENSSLSFDPALVVE